MQFFDRVAELERRHAIFAVATVVARRSPVSSHLGDRAVVFADGRMEGFVGGSCSRDIVRRQALGAIASGKPRLLHIRPDEADIGALTAEADGEQVFVPMGCASEGDVYIEPHIPLRRLLVAGFTPVADALARIAATLDYDVLRVVAREELRDAEAVTGARVLALDELGAYLESLEAYERARLVAIVASQGHYDEAVLETLLPVGSAYVGLLASRKRAASVFGVLAQAGMPAARIERVRTPVGLDIGARNPGEVAVSILAEIIGSTPALDEFPAPPAGACPEPVERAIDPVCGMEVEIAGARHVLERDGTTHYFCCAGCRAAFAAEPAHP
jgi:xanthine dehydrogenase accessory factor